MKHVFMQKDLPLQIPENKLSSQPDAGVLGAPLKVSENMYPELQNTYM